MSNLPAIWKYEFPVTDVTVLHMPGSAKILPTVSVSEANTLTIWAEVFPGSTTEEQVIRVLGTGHNVPAMPLDYIGTAHDGPFVWHVYHDYTKRSVRHDQ